MSLREPRTFPIPKHLILGTPTNLLIRQPSAIISPDTALELIRSPPFSPASNDKDTRSLRHVGVHERPQVSLEPYPIPPFDAQTLAIIHMGVVMHDDGGETRPYVREELYVAPAFAGGFFVAGEGR